MRRSRQDQDTVLDDIERRLRTLKWMAVVSFLLTALVLALI